MKSSWKKLWMLVSVLVLVGSIAACGNGEDDPDDDNGNGEEEDPKTVTVYFYNSEDWDDVYVQSDDHDELSDGLEATEESGEDKWYAVEFERDVLSDPITITFNDGGDNESEELEIDHPNQVYTTIYSDGIFGSRGGAEDYMNTTLYFYNSDNWDSVHVSSDDVAMLSDNPEVDADPDQEDWYSITVPVNLSKSSITVTFNDGTVENGTATTLDDPDQTYLTVQEDGLYGSFLEAEAKVSGNFTEVYFYNTAGWEEVTAHYWGHDDLEDTTWPGVNTTAVEGHENWVKAIVPDVNPGDEFNIIFNNGGNGSQTGDTEISNAEDLYLTYNEPDGDDFVPASKYSSFEDAENPATRLNFYNDQNWDSVEVSATDGDDESIDDVTIAQDGDSRFYTVEVPESAMEGTVNLTFSDGDGSTSDEITVTDDNKDLYLTTDADLTYTDRNTLTFYNVDEWSTVHADVETDEDTPRTILDNAEAAQDEDSDYWTVEIPTNLDDETYNVTFSDDDSNESDVLAVDDENVENIFTPDEAIVYTARTTITFYNEDGWTDVYADVETDEDTPRVLADEVAATQDEDTDWWSIEVPTNFDSEDYNVTFTDGDTNSSETVTMTDGNNPVLTMTADETYNNVDQAETWMNAESDDYETVWFYNSEGWTDLNAYIFGDYDILGAWPGMELTQDGDTDWWSIDIPADFSESDFTIIFNGADGNQTDNIPLENNTDLYISADGNTYDNKTDVEDAIPESLVFNGSDMDLGDYPDSETIYTIDGFDIAYEKLGNYPDNYDYDNPEEVIQIQADDGLLYNQTAIPNIQEIIITFDDNQEHAPSNLTMYGGTSEKDDSNVIEDSNSEDYVMSYDFSDTDYEYFYYTNGEYAAYAVEIEIIYEDDAN